MKRNIIVFVLFTLVLSSCAFFSAYFEPNDIAKKIDGQTTSTPGGGGGGASSSSSGFVNPFNTFVVGKQLIGTNYIACLWTNGLPILLTNASISPFRDSSANFILMTNNSIYIAGSLVSNGQNVIGFWTITNGNILFKTLDVTASVANVSGMVFKSNTLYIAGYNGNIGCYWTNANGVSGRNDLTNLGVSNMTIRGIGYDKISNNLYIIGNGDDGMDAYALIFYKEKPLTTNYFTISDGQYYSMAIYNSKAYFCNGGTSIDVSPVTSINLITQSNNFVPNAVAIVNIYIDDSGNFYTSGTATGAPTKHCFWINNSQYLLLTNSHILSIKGESGQAAAAGYVQFGSTYTYAYYSIGTNIIQLVTNSSYAYDIAIKPKP